MPVGPFAECRAWPLAAGLDAVGRARAASRGVMKSDTNLLPLAIGMAVVLLAAAAVYTFVWFARRRNRYGRNWRAFVDVVADGGFDQGQAEFLVRLARTERMFDPAQILRRLDVFEYAVDHHLRPLAGAGPQSPGLAAECSMIRGLREKLGFWAPRGGTYASTRELEPGLALRFGLVGQQRDADTWAETAAPREDFLEIVRMTHVPAGLPGASVDAVVFSRNRAFRFRSTVVRADEREATCLLTHTVDMQLAGEREFRRVPVDKPVTFRAAWEEDNIRRDGVLIDLSAGGAALRCPCFYETGEQLVLRLAPQAYYRQTSAEQPLPDRQVVGSVTRTRRTDDDECVYHIEFRDIDGRERQFLSQLVHRIDVRGIAAEA